MPVRKLIILTIVFCVLSSTAHAGCKWVSRGFKSYLRCTGDVAETIGDISEAGQDAAKTVLEELPQAAIDGAKHFSDQFGREIGDAGRDINQSVLQAGRDVNQATLKAGREINKTAIHFGKELERGGQNIGEFFEWATNFSLSCPAPHSPPDEIAEPYRAQCNGPLVSAKQNGHLCVSAGGLSMIVAGVANSGWTFGASLALAKAAFEICEQACRDQETLKNCIAKVDDQAIGAKTAADTKSAEARNLDMRRSALECRVQQLDRELLNRFIEIVDECETAEDCHPVFPESEEWIKKRQVEAQETYDAERAAAFALFDSDKPLDTNWPGPHLRSGESSELVLADSISNRKPVGKMCEPENSQTHLWSKVFGHTGKSVTHRWLHRPNEDTAFAEKFSISFRIGGDGWRVWSKKKLQSGDWRVVVETNTTQIGHYNFTVAE